jgi:DNA-binding transcriptional regulator YdaS (Cro superfamily)
MAESVQLATLRRALELAGSAFVLARKVGLSSQSIFAMLEGTEAVPSWAFLRVADYINEEQERPYRQPDFDAGWREAP